MTNTAIAVAPDHAASAGIISRTAGCDMSSVIQATNAQLAMQTIPIAVRISAWLRNRRTIAFMGKTLPAA